MTDKVDIGDVYNQIKKSSRESPSGRSGVWKILITAGVLFVALIVFMGMCIVVVPAGYVGVKYSWSGGVQEDEFTEGWHIKPPWIDVTTYSARTIEKTEAMHALSNEGLSVNMDSTILYHIIPDKAHAIHKEIGPDYENVVVMTNFRSVVREIVAEYQAIDIYTEKRAVLEKKVFDEVVRRLKEKNIVVESVLFRNVDLPPQLKQSIEEKKKAEQDALRMEYVLQKETQEAERKRVEAQGISDANKIIANSLTPQYLTWYWISSLGKHNSVIYVPIGENGMPLFKNIDEVRTNLTNSTQ